MIALAALGGGLLFLGLHLLVGRDAVVAVALGLFVIVAVGGLREIAQGIHDRRVARRRWREWHRG